MQGKKGELMKKALSDLAKQYPTGCIKYFEKARPEVVGHIVNAENRVNETYNGNIEDYKKALAYWYRLNLRAFELYAESKNVS